MLFRSHAKVMSGDLVPFVLQRAASRGGNPSTNDLPTIRAKWYLQSNLKTDSIYIPGDHFFEIQAVLRQAFGELDPTRGSHSPNSFGGASGSQPITNSFLYSSRQIGVIVSVAQTSPEETHITIAQRP